MATNEELNNQKNLNKEKKTTNQLDSQNSQYANEQAAAAASRIEFARSLTEELKDQLNIRTRLNETDKETLSLARQLQASVGQNIVELGNSGNIEKAIAKDKKLSLDITRELNTLLNISSKEQEEAAGKLVNLYNEVNRLTTEELELEKQLAEAGSDKSTELEEELEKKKKARIEAENAYATVRNTLGIQGEINQTEVDRIALLQLMIQNNNKNIQLKEDEAELQKNINDRMGVTGALVEGVGGIMQRLGMRSGIFNDAMSAAKNAMFELAEQAERGQKEVSKLEIALAGAKELSIGFGKALNDPLTKVLAIVDGFFKVDSSATKLQRLTGQNSRSIAGMNSRLATSVDFLETAAELTLQTGMNAQNVFSDDVLAGAAELKNVMGLAADEAGGLAMIAQTTSGDIDQVTDSIVKTTSAFNRSNRSAVSQGQVLRDVAKTSDSIKASFSGMPDELAKAAAAARRMGMDLNKLDQIAGSLLDFESSIEAELEAQLLTGNRINLTKAREFALTNKLKEVGEEIFKNSVSLNEFGRMNRIQQEAQAKALGLSREELGKIAYQRAILLGMTEEQAEAAAGVTAEDMKRLETQEAIQLAVAKLQQAFAPLLTAVAELANMVAPMIAGLAKFFASPFGKVVTVSYAIAKGFGLASLNIKGMVKNLGQFISKSAIAEKIMKNFGGSASVAGGITDKAKDKFEKPIAPSKKSAGGLKSLTGAIQKINVKSLLAGAAAMAVAAGSIFIFAKASQEFADVSWSDIGKATVGLIALVGAVTALGAIMSSGVGAVAILAGAAAIGIIAGSLYVLGAAIEKISGGLGEIANLGSAFDFASIGIDKMAASIYKLSEALQSIETEKVEELKALVATTALAAPVVAATGAITDLIQGIAGTGDAGTDTETIKKLDAILTAIKEGGDVYLDSSKVGQALAMGSYKSS